MPDILVENYISNLNNDKVSWFQADEFPFLELKHTLGDLARNGEE